MIEQNSKYNQSRQTEAGGVIFFILIAIVLFAALSYTISNMARSGDPSTITQERSRIYASEVIDYGRALKQAIQVLKIDGCQNTQISFENLIEGGYENPNAPNDESCNVFSLSGGGLNWVEPTEGITSTTTWLFTGLNRVQGVGSDVGGDLIIALPEIPTEVCVEINNQHNNNVINNPPSDDGAWDETKFIGALSATNVIAGSADGLEGLTSACFIDDTNRNVFYQVLITQ